MHVPSAFFAEACLWEPLGRIRSRGPSLPAAVVRCRIDDDLVRGAKGAVRICGRRLVRRTFRRRDRRGVTAASDSGSAQLALGILL